MVFEKYIKYHKSIGKKSLRNHQNHSSKKMMIISKIKNFLPFAKFFSKCSEPTKTLIKPERFGHSDGDSGWRWSNGGAGMGGKQFGPATGVKEGVGKDKVYKVEEYFSYGDKGEYFFYDMEKELVESGKRVEQPKSGLDEYWSGGA